MSFYTSLTGLNSATAQLAVTANNIANVDTTGFKVESLMQKTDPGQPAVTLDGPRPVKFVAADLVARNFGQGALNKTGAPLDMAIEGEGFFQKHTTSAFPAWIRTEMIQEEGEEPRSREDVHAVDVGRCHQRGEDVTRALAAARDAKGRKAFAVPLEAGSDDADCVRKSAQLLSVSRPSGKRPALRLAPPPCPPPRPPVAGTTARQPLWPAPDTP